MTTRPDPYDDRVAQIREELDALDAQRLQGRLEALDAIRHRRAEHAAAARTLDAAVAEAKAYGATWRQIAEAAGLTVSAAWERWARG